MGRKQAILNCDPLAAVHTSDWLLIFLMHWICRHRSGDGKACLLSSGGQPIRAKRALSHQPRPHTGLESGTGCHLHPFSVALVASSREEDRDEAGICWLRLSLAVLSPTVGFHAFCPIAPNGTLGPGIHGEGAMHPFVQQRHILNPAGVLAICKPSPPAQLHP